MTNEELKVEIITIKNHIRTLKEMAVDDYDIKEATRQLVNKYYKYLEELHDWYNAHDLDSHIPPHISKEMNNLSRSIESLERGTVERVILEPGGFLDMVDKYEKQYITTYLLKNRIKKLDFLRKEYVEKSELLDKMIKANSYIKNENPIQLLMDL